MSNNKLQMTLCPTCRDNFREAGYFVKRSNFDDGEKSSCGYCSYRMGYEHIVREPLKKTLKVKATGGETS